MLPPIDKQAHFFSGGFLAALFYPVGIETALLAVIAAAVFKELWDATGKGTPEALDAIATLLGGLLIGGYFHVIGL